MWSLAHKLRNKEKDLAFGYYRLNCNQIVPIEISLLSMMYLYVLDEFDKRSKGILISGINNCIAECKIGLKEVWDEKEQVYYYQKRFLFGRNIIKSNNFYHWTLKLISLPIKDDRLYAGVTFGIVSIAEDKWYLCNDCKRYGWKKNKIIDMYFDSKKGEISYYIDNHPFNKDNYDDIDSTINYKMCIGLFGKETSIQLIDFQQIKQSKSYDNYLQIAKCSLYVDDKIKYYNMALKLYPNMIQIHKDIFDCLLMCSGGYYCSNQAIEYVFKHNLKEFNNVRNLFTVAHFVGQHGDYEKALGLYKLVDLNTLIEYENLKSVAFCYSFIGRKTGNKTAYINSIKYFKLYLKHSEYWKDNRRKPNSWMAKIANIYYEKLNDYNNALELWLKIDDEYMEKKGFRNYYPIADCYKQLKKYDEAMIWWNKGLKNILVNDEYKTRIYNGMAVTSGGCLNNTDDGIKYSLMAHQHDPTNLECIENLVMYYFKKEEYEKSGQYIEKGLQIDANNEVCLQMQSKITQNINK